MLRYIAIVAGICVLCVAAEETITVEKAYDMAQNVLNATRQWENQNSSVEGRKTRFSPFHHFLPFHALFGFGGINALAILFAIKLKIIIVFFIVAFSIFYYTKFLAAKKFDQGGIREGAIYPMEAFAHGSPPGYSFSAPTGYSNHIDVASYNGPDPYNAYHDIHPDISSSIYDHSSHIHSDHGDFSSFHHDHEHDHYSHDHDHDHHHDYPPSDFTSSDTTGTGAGTVTDIGTAPAASTYKRNGKKRSIRSSKPQLDFMSFGEFAFQFLGLHTDGCRRRFVCELDFRAKTNPVTRLAFSFIGKNFFEQYRNVDDVNTVTPQKFTDCARMFNDCADAEKYNNPEDDDEESLDDGFENESNSDADHEQDTSTNNSLSNSVLESEADTNKNDGKVRRKRSDAVAHILLRNKY